MQHKQHYLFFIVAILLFITDRFLKFWAQNDLMAKEYLILPKYGGLGFKFYQNPNIAFSLPIQGWWLVIILIAVFIGLIYVLIKNWRRGNYPLILILILILLGALGNVIDRLLYGYVIDFINLFIWPAFNLADAMIVAGVVLWVWLGWKKAN